MRLRSFDSLIVIATVAAVLSLAPIPAAGQVPGAARVGPAPPRVVHARSLTETSSSQSSATFTPKAQGGCLEEPAEFHRCALERAKTFKPPRTSDGKPDLQGIWIGNGFDVGETRTLNIEEHPKTSWYRGGESIVVDPVDGKIPYQSWAAAKKKENVDVENNYIYRAAIDPRAQCLLDGVPRHVYAPYEYQILQVPGYVVIINEDNHAYRVIPTDGRPHVGENLRLWMGDSRGHWEANTLVVEVTNFNGKPWLDIAGNFTTDAVHIVERFTLVDANRIHYEATIEDPTVFTRPWKMAFPIVRIKDKGYELIEAACHEGNRDAAILLPSLRSSDTEKTGKENK